MWKVNFDTKPSVRIEGDFKVFEGIDSIQSEISRVVNNIKKKKIVITIEMYHGVYVEELFEILSQNLEIIGKFNASKANYDSETMDNILANEIGTDRIFGIMTHRNIDEFFIEENVKEIRTSINEIEKGVVIIYGIGASYIYKGDVLIYCDMPRWETQKRMRKDKISNWCSNNYELDYMRRYKRAFFIDWRVLDKYKQKIYHSIDYFIDSTDENNLKMVKSEAIFTGLAQVSKRPFRLLPYFDSGPWGGQWMKDKFGLDKEVSNFAWCFDCVPEENSLVLTFEDTTFEIPAINLVFEHPKELLGDRVYARFGKEFPIRFDILDTMDGGNLSLQVHPVVEYIQNTFGMHYTQDESYYMLDAKEGATVFLGLKENTEKEKFLEELERSNREVQEFKADRYINQFPAKKHDHFLIPAGTIHCSGKNNVVLEISATPYIFTFKLWDWGRLGMDGLPRPIHINHGREVIQWDRTTRWVKENLINKTINLTNTNSEVVEHTGLHELEFIETRRHWFHDKSCRETNGSVNVLNLVEGKEAVVESLNGEFEPFVVHYAETFIIPPSVEKYSISPIGNANENKLATITASVRV